MAENPQDKLKQAIAAAQRGDKTAARRMLQQVLGEDRENELAWIWMASVVDSIDERRACLERVLKINPNNARAKEALRRLGFDPTPTRETSEVSSVAAVANAAADAIRSGGNRTLYFAIATAVTILLIALVVASLLSGGGPSDEAVLGTATSFAIAQLPTDIPPTIDPDTYTPTPFFGVVVTLGADGTTPLPPTFTPTATATATEPPPATATPLPLSGFPFAYTLLVGDGEPRLFSANADGSGGRELAQTIGDPFAISPAGDRIAFVRLVPASGDFVQPTPAEGQEATELNEIPQVFVAPLNDPGAAQPITQMVGSTMSRPAWTPDGQRIVFTSNQDGDSELYIIDAAGDGAPTQLTNNEANDTDPAVSPDGRVIIFASDVETPGSQEIFSIAIDGGDVRQLTNASGSSTQPRYSPDGSRIVFTSDRGGDGDIWIMDANGQRAFLVTFDDGDAEDRTPVWTPDARWIMFVSNRGGESFQVYLISPDGSTLLPVTSGGDNVQSIDTLPISRAG